MSPPPTYGSRWENLDIPLAGIDVRSAPPYARGSLDLVNYSLDRAGGLVLRPGTEQVTLAGITPIGLSVLGDQPIVIGAYSDPRVIVRTPTGAWEEIGRRCRHTVARVAHLTDLDRKLRCPSVMSMPDGNAVVSWCQEDWAQPASHFVYGGDLATQIGRNDIGGGALTHVGPARWGRNGFGVQAVGARGGAVVNLTLYLLTYNAGAVTAGATTVISSVEAGAPPPNVTRVSYDADADPSADWIAFTAVDATTNKVWLTTWAAAGQRDQIEVGGTGAATLWAACAVRGIGSPKSYRVGVLWWTAAGVCTLNVYSCDTAGTALTLLSTTANVLTLPAGMAAWYGGTVEHRPTSDSWYVAASTRDGTWRSAVVHAVAGGAQQALGSVWLTERALVHTTGGADAVFQPMIHTYTSAGDALASPPAGVQALDSVWLLHEQSITGPPMGALVGPPALALRSVVLGPPPAGTLSRGVPFGSGSTSYVAEPVVNPPTKRLLTGDSDNGVTQRDYQTAGVQILRISEAAVSVARIGPYTLLAGGVPTLYDGVGLYEAGFAWRPELPAVAQGDDDAAYQLIDGTYQVQYVYGWFDGTGALHLSEPSPTRVFELYNGLSFNSGSVQPTALDVITGAVSGATATYLDFVHSSGSWGGGNETGTLLLTAQGAVAFQNAEALNNTTAAVADFATCQEDNVGRYRLTHTFSDLPVSKRPRPLGIVYRSQREQVVLQRASDGALGASGATSGCDWAVLGQGGAATIVANVNDNVAGANLAVRPNIYTAAGDIPNVCPSSCSFVHAHQDRVWLAGCETPNEVWFSHALRYGDNFPAYQRCPAWAPSLTITTDSAAVALGTVASTLIILCANDIYAVEGDGPGRSGIATNGGNGFSIRKIKTGLGCSQASSVVSAQDGVYFLSGRGLMRAGLDLAVVDVGAPVQALLDGALLTSPAVKPDRNEVWWVRTPSSGGRDILFYNAQFDQWGRHTIAAETGGQPATWRPFLVAAGSATTWLIVLSDAGAYELRRFNSALVVDKADVPTAVVQLPWIHVGGIVGYFRTRKMGVTGANLASATVTVNWRTDYLDSGGTDATLTLPAGSRHAVVHAPAGASKCEAISLRVSVAQAAAASPHAIWGITGEVQIMGGVHRRPSGERK